MSPEKPTGNRYDTMFGSEHESGSDDALSNASDDDEDAVSRKRKRPSPAATHHQPPADDVDEPLDDLFDEVLPGRPGRPGRPASTYDAAISPAEPDRFVDIALPRHPAPAPGVDSHLYLLKIPAFLPMEPNLFVPEKFVLPTVSPDESTSVYTKATTAIRVRRHPDNPAALQSNSRIIRWSDGTLSLQIASSPNLYDLPRKNLTTDPTQPDKYNATQDSHIFILDPHESAGTLRVVGHATQALNVVSASINLTSDHAIQRLHSELASAIPSSARKTPLEMSELKDPEAERKEAERIAKERERNNRKIEAQRRRARDRDPLEHAARRSYQKVTGTRSKRDSPPITRGGRAKEDEYDLEDDFLEGSEEEEEAQETVEEEEEIEERPRRGRGGSGGERKRRRVVESDEE